MHNTDRICFVTGASSGIGNAIAKALHADHYTVAATARRLERLQALGLDSADVFAGDLRDAAFQDSVIDSLFRRHGRCDYLFNCAGTIAVGTVEEIDIDKLTSMIRLNVEATIRLTYAFLKRFRQQGFGHIVNVSSVLGTKVRPTAGGYAATKFAIEALSEALRMELSGSAISISCIEPGLVMTELHNDWEQHPRESMKIHEPLSVDDIVRAVRFIMAQPPNVRIPKLMMLPRDHVI